MTCSLLNLLFTPYERHPWDKSKSEWLWLVTTMWWVAGTVERQAAHFYRITVTESDLKSGLIITCKSTGKDKFKLVFFDQEVSSDTWLVMMPRADTCVSRGTWPWCRRVSRTSGAPPRTCTWSPTGGTTWWSPCRFPWWSISRMTCLQSSWF